MNRLQESVSLTTGGSWVGYVRLWHFDGEVNMPLAPMWHHLGKVLCSHRGLQQRNPELVGFNASTLRRQLAHVAVT